jgi:hypothetical protein
MATKPDSTNSDSPQSLFRPGDRVRGIAGKYFRRSGTIRRLCSAVFSDYVYVTFDLRPRERKPKTEMVERAHLAALMDGAAS